jgi:hypothetical protein
MLLSANLVSLPPRPDDSVFRKLSRCRSAVPVYLKDLPSGHCRLRAVRGPDTKTAEGLLRKPLVEIGSIVFVSAGMEVYAVDRMNLDPDGKMDKAGRREKTNGMRVNMSNLSRLRQRSVYV